MHFSTLQVIIFTSMSWLMMLFWSTSFGHDQQVPYRTVILVMFEKLLPQIGSRWAQGSEFNLKVPAWSLAELERLKNFLNISVAIPKWVIWSMCLVSYGQSCIVSGVEELQLISVISYHQILAHQLSASLRIRDVPNLPRPARICPTAAQRCALSDRCLSLSTAHYTD